MRTKYKIAPVIVRHSWALWRVKDSAPGSLALSSRPPPLWPLLGSVDPTGVALELVGGLLVAGDVHQLEVL